MVIHRFMGFLKNFSLYANFFILRIDFFSIHVNFIVLLINFFSLQINFFGPRVNFFDLQPNFFVRLSIIFKIRYDFPKKRGAIPRTHPFASKHICHPHKKACPQVKGGKRASPPFPPHRTMIGHCFVK